MSIATNLGRSAELLKEQWRMQLSRMYLWKMIQDEGHREWQRLKEDAGRYLVQHGCRTFEGITTNSD